MTNLLGYHFVENQYTDAQIAAHLDHLRATRPAWINVLGGAQYNEALAFAKLVRQTIPETRVLFRHYKDGGDDGMHTRVTADEWFDKIGRLYIGSDLTIVTDNESMSDDLTYYATWQSRIMALGAQHKLSIGYGRFATHNPPSRQWSQLDVMFHAGHAGRHLHVWTPNAYISDTNFDGIEHIFEAWRRCKDIGIEAPPTVIGEFAYALNLDPHKGYRSTLMDGGEYVQRLLKHGAPLWAADVAACIYCIGEWPLKADTFSLDTAALKALRERVSKPPATEPPPYPALPAPTDTRWQNRTIVTAPDGVLMRGQPVIASNNIVSRQLKGTHVVGMIDGLTYGEWRAVRFAGFVGWIHSSGYELAVPPPTPVDYVTRVEMQAALDKLRAELRAEYEARLATFRRELAQRIEADETQEVKVAKAG